MGRQPLEYEQHQLYLYLKETAESDGTICPIEQIIQSLNYKHKKLQQHMLQLKREGYIQVGKPEYLTRLWKVI